MSEAQESQADAGYREPTHNSPYFITQPELGLILRLHNDGLSQVAIAKRLDKTQASISKALKRLGTDSTDLARHHLKAKAYNTARRLTKVAEKGKDADSVKAARLVLAGSGVITETSTVQLGIQVIIGGETQAALGAGSVQVEALDGTVVPLTEALDATR
jgi:hypothetical protein